MKKGWKGGWTGREERDGKVRGRSRKGLGIEEGLTGNGREEWEGVGLRTEGRKEMGKKAGLKRDGREDREGKGKMGRGKGEEGRVAKKERFLSDSKKKNK